MQKIRMVKTLDPENIPNGITGVTFDKDIKSPGLHQAIFRGWRVFVFAHEVELVEEEEP